MNSALSLESCLSRSYSKEELSTVWQRPLPRHVAVILDGNRRWMTRQLQSQTNNPFDGHWAGAEALACLVEAACDLGIEILTVFGFSTENWQRSPQEVDALLHILYCYLDQNRQKMVDQDIRFHIIGDLTPFSASLKRVIAQICEATRHNSGLDFVIALNYGGRQELCRAMQKMGRDIAEGRLECSSVTETMISSYLDTAAFSDPDLLIRTSGEKRISNFMLWQLAYTEIYITETLWPDFTAHDLLKAVLDFQKRQRRKGK